MYCTSSCGHILYHEGLWWTKDRIKWAWWVFTPVHPRSLFSLSTLRDAEGRRLRRYPRWSLGRCSHGGGSGHRGVRGGGRKELWRGKHNLCQNNSHTGWTPDCRLPFRKKKLNFGLPLWNYFSLEFRASAQGIICWTLVNALLLIMLLCRLSLFHV